MIDLHEEMRNIPITKRIKHAIEYFKSQRDMYSSYVNMESYILSIDDKKKEELLQKMITTIGRPIILKLIRNEIYLSYDYVYDFIYSWLVHKDFGFSSIYEDFVEYFKGFYFDENDILIFPIRGFGYSEESVSAFLKFRTLSYLFNKDLKCAIIPQTNSYKRSEILILKAVQDLGIKNAKYKIDLSYYTEVETLNWLKRNPLLVVAVTRKPANPYDLYQYLMLELKTRVYSFSLISTLCAPKLAKGNAFLLSTAEVNNWETWDYKHFLSIVNISQVKAEVSRIPIAIEKNEIIALTEMNFKLYYGSAVKNMKAYKKIVELVPKLKSLYIQAGISEDSLRDKFYNKLLSSLDFFHLSLSSQPQKRHSTLNLAIAFESLVSDKYEAGVTKKIHKHVRILLRNTSYLKILEARKEIKNLFNARGEIAHRGVQETDVDLQLCNLAYTAIFIKMMDNIDSIDLSKEKPIAEFVKSIDKIIV